MKVYYDQSPAGAGKTGRQIDEITKEPCKVLFVTERIESFHELEMRINAQAARNVSIPIIDTVHSDGSERLGSVSRQIEALPDRHRRHDHVVVLATHAGMMMSDLSNFAGWQIIVDEVPQFLDFEQKCTNLDALFFQRHYDLQHLHGSWSCVTANAHGLAVTPAQLRACQSHDHLVKFHERVLEASRDDSPRRVLCNLTDWKMMADEGVQWCWASTFSLWELAAFDKVTLLGNRFRADIGSKISEALTVEPIEWIELPKLTAMSGFMARNVHIKYFSEDRTSSKSYFTSDGGQTTLREIGNLLAHELKDKEHIWTANEPDEEEITPRGALETGGMIPGKYVSPRQAGTNNYRHIDHAAIIYSAKASPSLVSLLNVLGIDKSAWEQSVEHETILQFVTRTSVRTEGSMSPAHLWVFDRAQALYLKHYFDSLPYVSGTIELVTDAPVIPATGKLGRKKVVRSPEEKAEYDREKRARDAARKRKARAEARAFRKAA